MPEGFAPSPSGVPPGAQGDVGVNRFLFVLVCLVGFVLGFVPAYFVVGTRTLWLFTIVAIPLIVVVIVALARERAPPRRVRVDVTGCWRPPRQRSFPPGQPCFSSCSTSRSVGPGGS